MFGYMRNKAYICIINLKTYSIMGDRKYEAFIPDTYPLNGIKEDTSNSEKIYGGEFLLNKNRQSEKKEDMVVVWQEHM